MEGARTFHQLLEVEMKAPVMQPGLKQLVNLLVTFSVACISHRVHGWVVLNSSNLVFTGK